MSQNYRGFGGDGRPKQLSATAPEFVPRSFAPQQPQNGVGPGQGGPGGASLFLQQQQQQLALQQHMQMLQQQQHQQQQQMNRQQPNPYTTHGGPPGPHNYYQPQGGPHHYQSQQHGPSHNQRGGGGHHSQNQRGGHSQPQQPVIASPQDPMAQLKQAILILTKDPGMFDDAMPDLTSSLAGSIRTEEKLIQMVEEIFRQSVEEANFRYTGARVCNYFSHHLSVQFSLGNFRQHLLKRCHKEHEKREDLVKNSDNRYKLVGFTLFMAELLLNLTEFDKVGSSNDYMNIIANAVQELITTLLSQPADDTIRCVVQVLKLCGGVLEDSEKSKSEDEVTPRLDSVFAAIKESVLETSYHKGMRGQMLSVVELRAADWNRRDSGNAISSSSSSSQPISSVAAAPAPQMPPQQQPQQQQLSYNTNVPVNPAGMYFQDPSQQADSVIMSQFAQQQQQQQPGGFYPDDIYYYSSGEEDWQNQEEYIQHYMYNGVECIQEDDMDPEIAAAFNDFLQTQQPPQ